MGQTEEERRTGGLAAEGRRKKRKGTTRGMKGQRWNPASRPCWAERSNRNPCCTRTPSSTNSAHIMLSLYSYREVRLEVQICWNRCAALRECGNANLVSLYFTMDRDLQSSISHKRNKPNLNSIILIKLMRAETPIKNTCRMAWNIFFLHLWH